MLLKWNPPRDTWQEQIKRTYHVKLQTSGIEKLMQKKLAALIEIQILSKQTLGKILKYKTIASIIRYVQQIDKTTKDECIEGTLVNNTVIDLKFYSDIHYSTTKIN